MPPAVTDPNLVNPWGVSHAPSGPFWVSETGKSVSTLYDGTGAIQPLVVPVASVAGAIGPSLPTDQVFNFPSGFSVSSGGKTALALFLFDTVSCAVTGVNPSVSSSAIPAVDKSAHAAVYLGLAKSTDANGTYLLATNSPRASCKSTMPPSSRSASSEIKAVGIGAIPASYSPHNEAVVGGRIFVAYATVDAANGHEKVGYGLGFIDEVTLPGRLVQRVAIHGPLNAPWRRRPPRSAV